MKLIVNVFFALALVLTAAQTAGAESANGPALMTIRFNQKNVNYHDKLVEVVQKAIKTKSSVVFEVVDVTPAEGQGLFGQQIVSDIENLGVPSAQVVGSSEIGNVTNEEVRIFVR